MTREEAIEVFKHNYPASCFADLCEAVEIAIQVLSAQQEIIQRKENPMLMVSDYILKPCPFCGKEARLVTFVRNVGCAAACSSYAKVVCDSCLTRSVEVQDRKGDGRFVLEAINAWNSRNGEKCQIVCGLLEPEDEHD